MAAPTAGSNEQSAITTAHNTGALIPKNQKISPPRAPCTAATSRLPLKVARMTAVDLSTSAGCGSGGRGMACVMRLVRPSPSRTKKNSRYSMMAKLTRKLMVPDIERLRGKEHAAFAESIRQLRLHRSEVFQPEAIQKVGCPRRQYGKELLEERAGIPRAPLHALMKVGGLLHSEAAISVNGRMTKVKMIRTVARAGRFCRFGMACNSHSCSGVNTIASTAAQS